MANKCFVIARNVSGFVINKIKHFYYQITLRHSTILVKDIFMKQYKSDEFNRFDAVVRYLAVEDYYGKNKIGFRLYEKMQQKRLQQKDVDVNIERFKELIESWELNGYNASEISVDKNLMLIDGSHRLALSIYYRIRTINCKIYKCKTNYFYGLNWFENNGFSDDEIAIILKKEKEIKEKLLEI